MQRLATTVALAAWIGFLGVFSLAMGASILAPGSLDFVAGMAWPQALTLQFGGIDTIVGDLPAGLGLPLAAACLSIVVLFARSLLLLHSGRPASASRGETLAFAGLAVVAILAGIAQLSALPLLPIELDGGLVWLSIALSIAAVTFDRLVTVDDEAERTEAEFHESFAVLAERVGRQAALYALTDAAQGPFEKDRRP